MRRHTATVIVLSVVPLVVLATAAWLLGRLFDATTRDGLLAVSLASSEVATVGLVAPAGADATIALGAVAGSLVLSALLGPVAIGWLAGHPGHGGSVHLLGRFALVVIVPLVAGVALRSARGIGERLRGHDAEREGIAAVEVATLVYAALSGTSGAHGLGPAVAASLSFLLVSAAPAELWRRLAAGGRRAGGGAAGRAGDRHARLRGRRRARHPGVGSTASAVPGVYGVLMLLAGSVAASQAGER